MKKGFVNDGLPDARIPSKKNAREVATIWGEDYEPLIELLELCMENRIRTLACCSGHEEDKERGAYISFLLKGKFAYYLVNEMSKETEIIERISFIRNRIGPGLGIHSTFDKREEMFNKIRECIRRYISQYKKRDIKGFVKFRQRLRKPREDLQNSALKKILLLTYNKYFSHVVRYSPAYKLYYIQDFVSDEYYTEEEILAMNQERFIQRRNLTAGMPMIDKVKTICRNTGISLSRIGDIAFEFQQRIKANGNRNKEKEVEKFDER